MPLKKEIISINPVSPVSKYRQIIQSVQEAIGEGKLKTGDKIPSINDICKRWSLSRDTVINAYNELKSLGIIASAPGKGFYVISTNIRLTNNIFLLFDELNSFKEDLYNSFVRHLPPDAIVDIYFHYFNRKLFDQLIEESRGNYTTYVVMPAKFQHTLEMLQHLNGRVIILDQLPDDLRGHFPAIYQNFENDTFNALMSGKDLLAKYQSVVMVHPGGKEPEGQYLGFQKYCRHTGTQHELIHDLNGREIIKGEAYIVIGDRDLVWLMKEAQRRGLVVGIDLGIISYNDKALKEVAGNGVTTISTDFIKMGRTLAELVVNKSNSVIENPSSLIIRKSL
jgi:DNA-binding transcriptional regulator YhcF (GntR family)